MQLRVKIAATLAAPVLAVPLLTSAAQAQTGFMTHYEWTQIHSGESRSNIEATCNCTGNWVNSPGDNPKVIRYDNTTSNGYVEEYYVQQSGGAWRTYGSYWCTSGASCTKDF